MHEFLCTTNDNIHRDLYILIQIKSAIAYSFGFGYSTPDNFCYGSFNTQYEIYSTISRHIYTTV